MTIDPGLGDAGREARFFGCGLLLTRKGALAKITKNRLEIPRKASL